MGSIQADAYKLPGKAIIHIVNPHSESKTQCGKRIKDPVHIFRINMSQAEWYAEGCVRCDKSRHLDIQARLT